VLGSDQFLDGCTAAELRAHGRAGRGADDEVGGPEVHATIGQAGDQSEFPGNAGEAAATEHERRLVFDHGTSGARP
jgi:hypothetical protein